MSEPKPFHTKRITDLRSKASKAAKLPEEVPEGWSISTVDPVNVLAVFRPLRIKDGFVLRAYQFRSGGNGNGFVWAMPVNADFPDPEDCPRLEGVFLQPPKPPAALDHVMDTIDGDGSPWSYMCASILARELGEFGAMWHGCSWSTHTILGAIPWTTTRGKKKIRCKSLDNPTYRVGMGRTSTEGMEAQRRRTGSGSSSDVLHIQPIGSGSNLPPH